MNELEVVERLLSLVEADDRASAQELLADDFTFSGPVPEPISGLEWLGMHGKLHAAFPDWAFNMADLRIDGDVVRGTAQITGTHTGALDLSAMSLPTIPATNKRVKLPRDESELMVVGGKVKYFKTTPNPEAGVSGILKQLGVAVPDPSSA
jgi:hypothetical protein